MFRTPQAYLEGVFITIMTIMARGRTPRTPTPCSSGACSKSPPHACSRPGTLPAPRTTQVLYALALTFASARTKEELREDEKILGPMIAVCLAVVVWSFRTMYRRWKHAQVELVVTSVV